MRLALLGVLLAGVAAGAWWQFGSHARRSAPGASAAVTGPASGPVAAPATGPAAGPGPAGAPVPAQPAAAPVTGPETLASEAAEASPTTEADPPQGRTDVSWGHLAGLHRTHDELRLRASAAFVTEPDSGKVLLRKNEDAVLPIASLTKLMTALVVSEARLPLDEVITITEEDVDQERHSRSRLRVGTALPRGEALHLALMSSENRAAHALGRTSPGGLPAFVAAMNRKAAALGMKNTRFVDPTGLSNRNRSTARDVAALAAAASREPLVREFSTTPQHEVQLGNRIVRFNNSNRLVKNPHWQINLQKTGYIVEAGQCLTMNTHVAGRDVILVLLDSADRRSRLDDAERIKRWAGGAPTPPVVAAASPRAPHAGTARPERHARAPGGKQAARAERQARAKAERGAVPPRVHQTFLPREAAKRRKRQER